MRHAVHGPTGAFRSFAAEKMRICLIRPPILVPTWNQAALVTPPLGLAYVAAAVERAGHQVTVIDAVGLAIDRTSRWQRDCVLFGLRPDEVVDRIPADAARDRRLGRFLVRVAGVPRFGAADSPTLSAGTARAGRRARHGRAEQSLAEAPADLCVLGEGELTLVDIAERLDTADRLAANPFEPAQIPGIAYRTHADQIVRTPRRERMRDLDAIAWPAWHLLPIEEYLDRHLGFGVDRGRSMPVLASRGCPYQCTFCSSPAMWTTRWNVRSVDDLLAELVHYQQVYRVDNFDFYDLTAIVKKSWIKEFCHTILDRRLKFTWQLPSGTRSEAIDAEVAPLLYAAGCRNLSYSPESGSPAVLKRIKKRIEPERMLDSMSASLRAGINVKCNIMLGFPGETWREAGQSLRFIARMAWRGATT